MAKKSNSESQPGSRAGSVDFPEVERILAFMQKHGLEEFEYEREGFRVRLKKPSGPVDCWTRVVAGSRNCSRVAPRTRAARLLRRKQLPRRANPTPRTPKISTS